MLNRTWVSYVNAWKMPSTGPTLERYWLLFCRKLEETLILSLCSEKPGESPGCGVFSWVTKDDWCVSKVDRKATQMHYHEYKKCTCG
jgi:hypothetical protein